MLAGCNEFIDTETSCDGIDFSNVDAGPFDISNIEVGIRSLTGGEDGKHPSDIYLLDKSFEIIIAAEPIWLNTSKTFDIWGFIIPIASACVISPPYGISNITNLVVTATNLRGEDTDISESLDVMENYMNDVQSTPLPVPEYVSLEPRVSRSYILRANEKFDVKGEHIITVSMSTSNGKSFLASDGPYNFVLNP